MVGLLLTPPLRTLPSLISRLSSLTSFVRGLITINLENGYLRLYASYKIGRREKKIINFLRQETPRKILLYLLLGYACSLKELSKELNKYPSTLLFHIKKLIKNDIIKVASVKNNKIKMPKGTIKHSRFGKEVVYIFSDMGIYYTFYDLLIVYKDIIPEKQLLNYFLTEGKDHLSKRKRSPYDTVNAPNDAIDSTIEILFKIFPNPYYA